MKNTVIVIGLALGVSASFVAAQQADSQAGQAPATQAGSAGDLAGYHLFQPRFQESLKLDPDQQKKVSALDVDVKSKLGIILTAEQFQLLNRTHPRRGQNAPAGGQGGSASAGPDGQSVSGGQGGAGIEENKSGNIQSGDPVEPIGRNAANVALPKVSGFRLIAPRTQELLALNSDQQKQVTALEVEVKGKLDTILNAEQLKQLEQMRSPQHADEQSISGAQPGSAPTPNAGSAPTRP